MCFGFALHPKFLELKKHSRRARGRGVAEMGVLKGVYACKVSALTPSLPL